MNPQKSLTIKSLTRTPVGSVFVHDLKDVLAALLCKLELTDEVSAKKPSIFSLISKKHYPYTFTLKRAIEVMGDLSLNIKHGVTLTKISYETKPKIAMELMHIFFSAKMFHCPEDKTMETLRSVSQSVVLQPTPKGVAVLNWFCQRIGISQSTNMGLPEILGSNFNSMELITFERDPRSDIIIHNEYWDKLLFLQVMGPKMNIWSTTAPADEIKLLGISFFNLATNDAGCSFVNPSLAFSNEEGFFEYLRNRQAEHDMKMQTEREKAAKSSQSQLKSPKTANRSPFYHKFFTNPDSDSHVQYYTSKNGVRFFKTKSAVVDGKRVEIPCCFSGKAIVQYLMDCTDLMYPKEAIKMASFFLTYNLIENACSTVETEFIPTKSALYRLTTKGMELTKWNDPLATSPRMSFDPLSSCQSSEQDFESESDSLQDNELHVPIQSNHTQSNEDYSDLTLKDILKDPGLKFLFRHFMVANLCVENINAYDDIVEFQRRIAVLEKLLTLKDKAKEKYMRRTNVMELIQEDCNNNKVLVTFRAAIKRLCEMSLVKVYNIYAMYLSDNAPSELNMDSNIKATIQRLITNEANMNLIQSSSLSFNDTEAVSPKYPSLTNSSGVSQRLGKEDNAPSTIREVPIKPTSSSVLTLDLKRKNTDNSSPSPTDIVLGPTLMFLDEVNTYYEQIKVQTVIMMEKDSLSKFLSSQEFNALNVHLPNR